MSTLHVLFIPSFYSDPHRPLCGIFFKEQAVAIAKMGAKVGLVYFEPRSLRSFGPRALSQSHFQTSTNMEDGILTARWHGWNPLSQTALGSKVWIFLMTQLVNRYIAKNGKPDVLHAQCALWGGEVARRVSKKHRIPYVVTEHSTLFVSGSDEANRFRRQLGRIYKEAAGVSAVTRYLTEHMRPFTADVCVALTPNLLPPDFEAPLPERKACQAFTYLTVGRLVPQKGHDILLKAFVQIRTRNSNCELFIVGAGPEEARLKELAKSMDLSKCVSFLGELTRKQVRDVMMKSDAFVLPSLYETFGIVAIEAMSCGLPVIATRGAPTELITPEVGILINPGDPVELADAMLTIEKKGGSAEAIRRYAVNHFGSVSFNTNLADFYAKSLRSRHILTGD